MDDDGDIPVTSYDLTEQQCQLLLICWGEETNRSFEFGADTYKTMFTSQPAILDLFPAVKRRGGAVMQNPAFLKLVRVFTEAMSSLIKACENAETVSKLAREIGAKHAAYAERGMRPEHFHNIRHAMKSIMTKIILKDKSLSASDRSTAVQAWISFTGFLVEEMKIGFLAALEEEAEEEDDDTHEEDGEGEDNQEVEQEDNNA